MKKHSDNPSQLETRSLSAIEHLLAHRPEMIRSLRLSDRDNARVAQIESLAREHGIKPTRGSLGEGENAIAVLTPFQFLEWREWLEKQADVPRALVVALDHVHDPQNFGAICRTAEALGVAAILLPKNRSVTVTGAVFAASAGAVATLPIAVVTNLGEALRQLKDKGFWIVGSTLGEGATPIEEMPEFEKVALVLGAEGEGMAPLTQTLCDWKLYVPLRGLVQSLNVSAAAAILIHELSKRCLSTSGAKD